MPCRDRKIIRDTVDEGNRFSVDTVPALWKSAVVPNVSGYLNQLMLVTRDLNIKAGNLHRQRAAVGGCLQSMRDSQSHFTSATPTAIGYSDKIGSMFFGNDSAC